MLNRLIDDYLENHEHRRQDEVAWFGNQELSLVEAIDRACRSALPNARNQEVRHSHQTRLNAGVLSEASRVLRARSDKLRRSRAFVDIIEEVDAAIGAIHGVGPLYVYDVSERLGGYLGHRPEKVYLHRGVRDGAATLDPAFRKRETLEMHELPKELRRLTPTQVEDFLCIYKAWLSGDRKAPASGCGRSSLIQQVSRC
jgi:hypothetical protein